MHTCTHAHMHTCTHWDTYTHAHVHIGTHTHMHMCTCAHSTHAHTAHMHTPTQVVMVTFIETENILLLVDVLLQEPLYLYKSWDL